MDERLARTLNGGVEETALPSGMAVRGVRPEVDDLIRRRLLPPELRNALARSADRPEDAAALDDEEREEVAAAGLDYLDHAAAAFVQEYRFDPRAAWRPLELSVEQFRKMAPEDRAHLRDFVRRREEVAELTEFRDGDGRPPRGEDGEDVAHDAEPAAAGARRRRGVRAR